ncbi:MAG TPA: DinB family protein [Candidatus Bathyarchaeia archaeon]|nr:DinB family protein [Candidatus Bathyarchaeia archaeon]
MTIDRTSLEKSRTRVLATVPASGHRIVVGATGARTVTAWALAPAPRDPVRHLEAAHALAREHLRRLAGHDGAPEAASVMTEELFVRLTDARPAPLAAPTAPRGYTYTPRKCLRRVLDHTLDHLNQIDQWLLWRDRGVVPTPTDGWVPSTVTLPDDRLPLTPADLEAWLWRIDQAARLLVQRAAGLTAADLDWQPPDGGWPLRRVLHHVARSELLYSTAFAEASEEPDPVRRYDAVCRRLDAAARAVEARGPDPSIVYAGLYGVLRTPEELVGDLLTMEGELLDTAGR